MRIQVFGPRTTYPASIGVPQVFWILRMLHGLSQSVGDPEFVVISGLAHEPIPDTRPTRYRAVGVDLWGAQWARDHRKLGVGLWAKSIVRRVEGWEPVDEPNWHISSVGGWKKFKGNGAAFERNRLLLVEGRPTHAVGLMDASTGRGTGTDLMFRILNKQRQYAPDLPTVRKCVITPDQELTWPIDWKE